METFERLTPLESARLGGRLRNAIILVVIAVLLLLVFFNRFAPNRPVEYANDRDHFYYGSIGSDISGGLPLKVLRVLPRMFPEYLPPGARATDYTAFGFLQEPGHAMPIGFSTRRQLIDLSAINCAACHTGSVREKAGSEPKHIAGMPANTLNLLAYFKFLFSCAADARFNSAEILSQMSQAGLLETGDALIYRLVIPRMRQGLLDQSRKLGFLMDPGYTLFGPGRVNTFDTFKVDQFAPYYLKHGQQIGPDEIYGIVDFPSVWNQAARDGLRLHWDGNNSSLRERNFSAAIGAGAHPQDMDIKRLFRVEEWLKRLPPPAYPFAIDEAKAKQGAEVYKSRCFDCHDFHGTRVATVFSLSKTDIGTDRSRLDSYTEFLRLAQQDYTKGYFWTFTHFTKTDGYTAPPLDGIWARAPYLHNGSVPNLWTLLEPEEKRPVAFTVGNDVYDQANMGFETVLLTGNRAQGYSQANGARYTGQSFVYDTRLRANGNKGHSGPRYGTDLSANDKAALIEYFKWQEKAAREK
jgi:hypothetical protein